MMSKNSGNKNENVHGNRFKGKVAIITASTQGIGYAIAKRLGEEGASVVVSSRNEVNVNTAVKSLREQGIAVEGVVCHVANAEQRKQLFLVANQKFGGLDILISNAAVNPSLDPILKSEDSKWDKIFDVNVKCSWLLAKEAHPELLKRGGGNIVFISSISAYRAIHPIGPYAVSKTALLGLTKAIAYETIKDNIRVNCVAPGGVTTKFSEVLISEEEIRKRSLSLHAMGRFGTTTEIAGAVAFIASDDASFITGETLVVAGGAYAHL